MWCGWVCRSCGGQSDVGCGVSVRGGVHVVCVGGLGLTTDCPPHKRPTHAHHMDTGRNRHTPGHAGVPHPPTPPEPGNGNLGEAPPHMNHMNDTRKIGGGTAHAPRGTVQDDHTLLQLALLNALSHFRGSLPRGKRARKAPTRKRSSPVLLWSWTQCS